jgi:hypothetical protein
LKEDEKMAEDSESKVEVYLPRRIQLTPKSAETAISYSNRKPAEKKKQETDEPIYLYRL